MTTSAVSTPAGAALSVPRATALYIGALFGPGLLLLPGLAAEQAGPASLIAWLALLGLSAIVAVVFAALGQAVPSAAGAAGYAAAGLGRRAAAMTQWWFLAGVIAGAPIVCLIGASYVTALTGGGPLVRAAIAAGLLLAVLGLALGGVRASALAQLLLVALLIVVVVTAVAGSAPAARPANWTPFAPHGWLSVGRAASTLMLSFVGWEAVAPLTGRLRAGQLSRVIGIAFTVTAVLYLGLAVATISCLGRGANLAVPLADLLQLALPTSGGPAGRAVAAAAALVLTAGSVNAYLSGATEMLRELTAVPSPMNPNGPGRLPRLSCHAFLGVIALAGLALIALSAFGLADIAVLVSVPTAMFLCVYLSCTAAAARILTGKARAAAAVAVLAVLAILAFCGWALLAAAVIAAAAAVATRPAHGGYPPAEVGWHAAAAGRAVSVASITSELHATKGMHDDPGTGARQALRRHRCGQRLQLHDPARRGHGVPRPERRRQDHHHAADPRPGPPVRRVRHRQRQALRPAARPDARGRGAAGRRGRARRPHRAPPPARPGPDQRHRPSPGR
jgi:amino acid efflux transporter